MTLVLRGAGRARGESGKEGGEGFTPVFFEIGFGLCGIPWAAFLERQHPSRAGGSSAQGCGVLGRSPVTKQIHLLWNWRCSQTQEQHIKPSSTAAVLLTPRRRRDGFIRSLLLGSVPCPGCSSGSWPHCWMPWVALSSTKTCSEAVSCSQAPGVLE